MGVEITKEDIIKPLNPQVVTNKPESTGNILGTGNSTIDSINSLIQGLNTLMINIKSLRENATTPEKDLSIPPVNKMEKPELPEQKQDNKEIDLSKINIEIEYDIILNQINQLLTLYGSYSVKDLIKILNEKKSTIIKWLDSNKKTFIKLKC